MAFAELRAQPAIGRLSSVGKTKKSAGFSLPPAFSLPPSRLHRRCPLGCTLPMAQEQNFTPVQYSGNLCGNWHQECARLYGHRTYRWQQCMQQPQALEDCGRGGYRGYRGQTSSSQCGNWHRECARLYGRGSYEWQCDSRQPFGTVSGAASTASRLRSSGSDGAVAG